ncbi:YciI family protein [Minwuia sp.]|uniref:YciI family protein n=1 Tax=Minwuia sp. TaxID=2493630 RepID=UPI003A9090C8
MKQFILLLHEKAGLDDAMSPDEMQSVIQEYVAWSNEMGERGLLVSGERLDSDGGRVIRPATGEMIVSDGPYAETKDIVSGFFIVKSETLHGAIELAKTCPHAVRGHPIEVRLLPDA